MVFSIQSLLYQTSIYFSPSHGGTSTCVQGKHERNRYPYSLCSQLLRQQFFYLTSCVRHSLLTTQDTQEPNSRTTACSRVPGVLNTIRLKQCGNLAEKNRIHFIKNTNSISSNNSITYSCLSLCIIIINNEYFNLYPILQSDSYNIK